MTHDGVYGIHMSRAPQLRDTIDRVIGDACEHRDGQKPFRRRAMHARSPFASNPPGARGAVDAKLHVASDDNAERQTLNVNPLRLELGITQTRAPGEF
jgi:hypothetical protein